MIYLLTLSFENLSEVPIIPTKFTGDGFVAVDAVALLSIASAVFVLYSFFFSSFLAKLLCFKSVIVGLICELIIASLSTFVVVLVVRLGFCCNSLNTIVA